MRVRSCLVPENDETDMTRDEFNARLAAAEQVQFFTSREEWLASLPAMPSLIDSLWPAVNGYGLTTNVNAIQSYYREYVTLDVVVTDPISAGQPAIR